MVLNVISVLCSTVLVLSYKLQTNKETILHNGRTMARVQGSNDSVDLCSLSVVDERVKEEHIANLEKDNYTVTQIDFDTMLDVLEACDNLTDNSLVNRLDTEVADSEVGFWSLIRGIIPGTLWCGVNDIADSYSSLGQNTRVDRCCRAHDHCPHKIKSFSSKQGLLNSTPYTKSNCKCDEIFYNCLKNSNSSTGNSVGNFYFNILNLQCIDMRQPKRCSKWKGVEAANETNTKDTAENDEALIQQQEDIFIPNAEENDKNTTDKTVGILAQQESILNGTKLPDYYLLPRTQCQEWVDDENKTEKLTFIDNKFEY